MYKGRGGGETVYCDIWRHDLENLIDILITALTIAHFSFITGENKQHAHPPPPFSSWRPRPPPPWAAKPGLSSHLRRVVYLLLGIGGPLLIVIRFFFVILPWLYATFSRYFRVGVFLGLVVVFVRGILSRSCRWISGAVFTCSGFVRRCPRLTRIPSRLSAVSASRVSLMLTSTSSSFRSLSTILTSWETLVCPYPSKHHTETPQDE